MTNLLNGVMHDVRSLLLGVIILMAIGFVIVTWAKTKSLVPTLGAFLLGVIVIAGVSRYQTLRTVIDDDISRYTEDTNPPLAEDPVGG